MQSTMTKTGQQIEDDIYEMLKSSSLPSIINGKIYKFGTRPKDSKAEDAVVKFISGVEGQIQTGSVAVNIYVPDIDMADSGVFVRDITRLTQIENTTRSWVETLGPSNSNYLFALSTTIQSLQDAQIRQHFVSVHLAYKLSTF